MSKKYKCSKCENIFNDQDAFCEDRLDSHRSFGCPRCKTFYKKPKKDVDFVQLLLAIFLVIPAFFILFRSIEPFNILGVGLFFLVMVGYLFYIAFQARKNIVQTLENTEC